MQINSSFMPSSAGTETRRPNTTSTAPAAMAAMNATNDSTMFHLSQILITFLSSNTLLLLLIAMLLMLGLLLQSLLNIYKKKKLFHFAISK